jgi:hypothetical protein
MLSGVDFEKVTLQFATLTLFSSTFLLHVVFRQQIKEALIQQTELQFRQYAKQQFPDNVKQVGYVSRSVN